MRLPLGLILPAVLAAAAVAYGTHPAWGQYAHGLDVILVARRLQGPLVALSLALCLSLLALVAAGKRRAWWLVALLPVLTLFVHRFVTDPVNKLSVVESPPFVPAAQATFVGDADYVVGLKFGDVAYAYPYAALYSAPVLVQDDHDRRLVLMWSAFANRAVAVVTSREVRARDLDIVGNPANALLLYNGRVGQFINGLTGLTPKGERPTGFRDRVPTVKMTWKQWRQQNPETKVFALTTTPDPRAPKGPLRPSLPMPPAPDGRKAEEWVTLVGTTRPSAVRCDDVGGEPLNLHADDVPVLLFRSAPDGAVRAFNRQLEDLSPRFDVNTKSKWPDARFVDRDTGSGWDANGKALYGPKEYKGRKLPPVPVEDDLYWGVMKFWYPQLELHDQREKMR